MGRRISRSPNFQSNLSEASADPYPRGQNVGLSPLSRLTNPVPDFILTETTFRLQALGVRWCSASHSLAFSPISSRFERS
ncbi:hypothetical protein L6452_00004 [Arctium lappa]|uniref:Uncharacterized protein n=1 Tax=Arctium lappa TaxID=4217 RepID=A0ACB9FC17_ARCLA|nr:hypothetical protein L6452_00004 [Arctium lappa]